jgi:PAS domain S-box-containing protein
VPDKSFPAENGRRADFARAAWIAAAAVLALAIFLVDTFSPFGIAIAVLYVLVVLISNQFASRNGLLLIALGCGALTLIGFSIDHSVERIDEATARCAISLAALAITTIILLRGKKVLGELEESEARNRLFLNLSSVSFWRLDVRGLNAMFDSLRATGVADFGEYADANPGFVDKAMEVTTIVDVNETSVQLFGAKDRSELIGRSVRYAWPPAQYDVYLRAIEGGFQGDASFQAETVLRRLDGREFDALLCVAAPPEIRSRGTILVAHIDISEHVKARTALAGMQSDLAHAARLSMLGEFTASIAHEVNQPLAAIATNGEAGLRWLARPEPDVAEARTLMGRIIADARRAAAVIARIRNMATKRSVERAAQSINQVIDETVMFVRHELQAHGVELTLDLAADLPAVVMDRVQIQQVVSNLVVNAIQAMNGHHVARPRISIASRLADDGRVNILVADNGPGIPPADQERLFDSFFTTKTGGMGLGLPISRSIVEAHGGTITVDDPPAGGGAGFTISLPPMQARAAALG